MSKTLLNEGKALTYTASGASFVSGQPVLIGTRIGICEVAIADGESGTVSVAGRHRVPKNNAQAWTQCAKVYWDDTSKVFTTTASGNTLVGFIAEAADSADEFGDVVINSMNA